MNNTVADLIRLLSQLSPKMVVLLSSDEEGNLFNTWSGDHGLARNNEWGEWDCFKYDEDGNESPVKAVILWP